MIRTKKGLPSTNIAIQSVITEKGKKNQYTLIGRDLTQIGENLNNSNEFEYSLIFNSIQIDFLIFLFIHIQFK